MPWSTKHQVASSIDIHRTRQEPTCPTHCQIRTHSPDQLYSSTCSSMACKQVIRSTLDSQSVAIPCLFVFKSCEERLAQCLQSAIHFVPCINSTSGCGKDTRKQVYACLHAKRFYTAGGMLRNCSFGTLTLAGLPVVNNNHSHALVMLCWVPCWTCSNDQSTDENAPAAGV